MNRMQMMVEKELVIQSQKSEIESAKRDVGNLKKLLNEQIKANYQTELLDMFNRRVKKLEDDLRVLETEGTLDNVKPQVL